MVFKQIAYRIGCGKNIVGKRVDGRNLVYYKTRDGVVAIKEIKREAGGVNILKDNTSFNATTVVPLDEGFILANKDREVKSIVNKE